jgi:hypothetical protein
MNVTELMREYLNTTDEAEALRLLDLINAHLEKEGKLV